MSFASDINTVLQGNATLNAAVGSRIYSYSLPDNLDISLPSIVFNYKKESGTHTLGEDNVLEDYYLFVVLLAPDPEINETNADLVRAFLDEHSDAKIREVIFEGDSNGLDQEKERFFKSLEYKITYQK